MLTLRTIHKLINNLIGAVNELRDEHEKRFPDRAEVAYQKRQIKKHKQELINYIINGK